MARIYSASRIVFNRSIGNDVNMRVFEALACGSMLVTNDLAENGLAELFQDGVHLATYREPGEMLEVIRYYLDHADRREAIAAAGRAEAVGRHTYRHRMERLLAEAETRLARTVVSVGVETEPPGGENAPPNRPVPRRSEANRTMTPQRVDGSDAAVASSGRPQQRPDQGEATGPRWERGLTSVIVPCWNQLEFTRLCLRALFRHTERPWELIVVDNGSTDGTGEFLAGVQVGGRVPVTIIHNARNLGFPAAINQGLRAARGEFLVLLNNDAVVTEAWLDHLVALTATPLETAAGDEEILDGESREGAPGE